MSRKATKRALLPKQCHDVPFPPAAFAASLGVAQKHAQAMMLGGNALTLSFSVDPADGQVGFDDAAQRIARDIFDAADEGEHDDSFSVDYHYQLVTAAYLLGIGAAMQFPDLFRGLLSLQPAKGGR